MEVELAKLHPLLLQSENALRTKNALSIKLAFMECAGIHAIVDLMLNAESKIINLSVHVAKALTEILKLTVHKVNVCFLLKHPNYYGINFTLLKIFIIFSWM